MRLVCSYTSAIASRRAATWPANSSGQVAGGCPQAVSFHATRMRCSSESDTGWDTVSVTRRHLSGGGTGGAVVVAVGQAQPSSGTSWSRAYGMLSTVPKDRAAPSGGVS
ncbi:hypothetical protein Cco03nite_57530 [Catellatospora coxensis]|uniref:Uncharacterized protein n=1 Tax=Catellatospora coxensis TaxID=310354 RepID=A0A8J3KUV6_9ACTN|nr:hypothetical protein Cco03nite_57530 [Catellatospora coxensis]